MHFSSEVFELLQTLRASFVHTLFEHEIVVIVSSISTSIRHFVLSFSSSLHDEFVVVVVVVDGSLDSLLLKVVVIVVIVAVVGSACISCCFCCFSSC